MGGPMAVNLVKAGHEVTGWNRTRSKVDPLVAAGGTAADSIAEAVLDKDIVITMVPASPEVEEVCYGEDGVLAHARRGALLIDFSSITPSTSVELAKAAAERGIRTLDAPVSGGEAGAIEGALSIMVGGEQRVFEEAQPIFDAVGKTIVHVGPAGAGQTVKAANQLIVAVNIEAVSEALAFLEASGVDTEAGLRVLGGGLAGSAVLNRKGDGMRAREFKPGFKLDLHAKDMGIATDAAQEAGVTVPLGALAAQLVHSACATGDGQLDHSALLRGVLRLSGKPVDGKDV